MDFDLIKWDEKSVLQFHKSAIKDGYRLATVNEARKIQAKVKELFVGTKSYMEHNTRLLDGWMSRDDFPSGGYIELAWDWWLVVKIGKASVDLYSDLSREEKEEALFFFTRDGYTELVEWLLSSIGDVPREKKKEEGVEFKQTNDGKTPLHLAFSVSGEELEKKEMVNVILKACRDEATQKDLIRTRDALGMTALLEAVKGGHVEIVKELLRKGAQPLEERDNDAKTALHYAVQQLDECKAMRLVELVLSRCYSDKCREIRSADKRENEDECICKSLLLWAKASGVSIAQESAKSRRASQVSKYLLREMNKLNSSNINLLDIAVKLENYGMIRELRKRDLDFHEISSSPRAVKEEIDNIHWTSKNVVDTPATEDNLGRQDIATGLAKLFLNPHIDSPIVVGLSGESGSGKSSLLHQVERILLQTTAQLVFPNVWYTMESGMIRESKTKCVLSHKGERLYRSIEKKAERLLGPKEAENYKRMEKEAKKFLMDDERPDQASIQLDPVQCLLGAYYNYQDEFENVFKSLAIKDKSLITEIVEDHQLPRIFTLLQKAWRRITWSNRQSVRSKDQTLHRPSPAILTVQYDAWEYRNESEAWAGLAVEITREMERRMSLAQRLAAIWNYAWTNSKKDLLLRLIFPFLLVVALAPLISWGAWVLMSRSNIPGLESFGYGCIPVSVIVILWTIVQNAIGTFNSVSDQIGKYVGTPIDTTHAQKLGYQKTVIKDIKFMKEMIGKQSFSLWKLVACCFLIIWKWQHLMISFGVHMVQKAVKSMYEKAGYTGEELEVEIDKYLQKICQVPLDLPDPSKDHFKAFLNSRLGAQTKANDTQSASSVTETNVSSSNQAQAQQASSQHSGTDQSCDLEEGKAPPVHKMPSSKETKKQEIMLNPLITVEGLMFEYSESEKTVFSELGERVTMVETNPRDWKRMLLYHKLVWNILSQRDEVTKLSGWQEQLVMWIVVCWRWKDEMDKIIENWERYVDVNTRSLRDIVQKKRRMEHNTASKEEPMITKIQELDELFNALKRRPGISVEKDAIIAFQAFRFNCKSKFLSFDP
eukprot:Gb_38079 [translate_table: standard]